MTTNANQRTVTVELPPPSGRYRDTFAGGASIGSVTDVDALAVFIDRAYHGPLTSNRARELAASLLAGADALDVLNRELRGAAAVQEMDAWNSTEPGIEAAEERGARFRVGDVVGSLDGLFGPQRVNLGTVTAVDAGADTVFVGADWIEPVEYTLDQAGRLLYLADEKVAA